MPPLTDQQIRDVLPHLQRFALWLTRNPHSAEDLVQGCLTRALSRWSGYRGEESLRAWLFAILYRQFIDGERRRKRYQRLLGFFTGEELSGDSAETLAIADETLQQFARLSADARALLLLISVEGMSYQEAATALAIPVGTVMSRLSRARKQLHQHLDGQTSAVAFRRIK
ncbi:sigma-70 family RNA polymerase sigma factor [Erwinia sp. MMLR14_017]|uniref:RNA polymerase sigma factor n=1 Tax=Erwinia sp. MMLR14_017 TaxID=3093842 RepID=UPI002990570E|nr:sigma-70 family RNA polymerase sigma factor [Erwinia sp. MMLR14_017]MDW8844627.1 sigma-70 family RNA polymerase sigma factor [Erwinia sp. MMLR14_017]